MSEQTESEITEDDSEARATLSWEVPEIAAMAVLLAFAALVLGGLVAGIILSTEVSGPVPRQVIGEAIEFGSSWAEPLLAVALLSVVGLNWWQIEVRKDTAQDDEIQGRRERAYRIGLAAQAALFLVVAGSIAVLIGEVFLNIVNSAGIWSRYVLSGASLVGVFIITTAGWWIGRSARAGRPEYAR